MCFSFKIKLVYQPNTEKKYWQNTDCVRAFSESRIKLIFLTFSKLFTRQRQVAQEVSIVCSQNNKSGSVLNALGH